MKETDFEQFVHRSSDELAAGIDNIRDSPRDHGTVELIVRRPDIDEREVVDHAELTLELGMVGDTWIKRSSRRTDDGGPHPEMQLNIMNARLAALIAPDRQRWALAGDQLFVDLDLSESNLPPGTRLALGTAVIEVTAQPHAGCAKFSRRFGPDALRFVNSRELADLRLRGINAKVVQAGTLHSGDTIAKL